MPRPVVRRAAKVAQPVDVHTKRGHTDIPAFVQGLSAGIKLQPAAFQQGDSFGCPDELPGHTDPGGAGADDANIRLDRVTVRQVVDVYEHDRRVGF